MKDQFSSGGLLQNFYNTVHNGENVNLKSIQREIILQNLVASIRDEISEKASEATVQQFDGAYVRMKLFKNDKTYGYMYSLLEGMKSKFAIKEYQIK